MIVSAVGLTSVALAVHIAAVVVGFGPLFVYPALVAVVRRSDPEALAALHRGQQLVATRVVTPALPLLLIAGLYLAGEEDAFGKVRVVVAMVMIVILMAMHRLLLMRGYRQLAEEAGSIDGPSTRRYQALGATNGPRPGGGRWPGPIHDLRDDRQAVRVTMSDSGDKATRTHDPEPHQARQMAESFGSDPERYDRARPRYPEAMVARIAAASPGHEFLDVGCGTGIASRQFQAAGCEVLGVEPDARMAEFARRRGLAVNVARFESWDAAGRAFDAVIAGQAWHWVDPLAGAAKAAQVLRPDGRLAAFWNVFQAEPEIANTLSEVYRRVVPEWPRNPWARPGLDAYSAILQRAADGMRATGTLSPTEQWRFDWKQSYTREEWLEQMATGGDASQFPPAKLDALLAGTGVAIDAWGGEFTMGYATVVITATRIGVAPWPRKELATSPVQ